MNVFILVMMCVMFLFKFNVFVYCVFAFTVVCAVLLCVSFDVKYELVRDLSFLVGFLFVFNV